MVNYLTANLVALAGLLAGASVVHLIYRPDLVRLQGMLSFLLVICAEFAYMQWTVQSIELYTGEDAEKSSTGEQANKANKELS